jgi:hypothetical protein
VGFKFENRHDLKPCHYGLVFSKLGKEWVIEVGFKFENRHDLKPCHYGLVFSKLGRE